MTDARHLPLLPLDRLPALDRQPPLDLDDARWGRPHWQCARYACGCAITTSSGATTRHSFSGELTQFALAHMRSPDCASAPSITEHAVPARCTHCQLADR